MKRIGLALAIMVACSCVAAAAPYGGGLGTLSDPYQIWTAEQMNQIGLHQEDWGKHFKLMADIDLGYYDGLDGRPVFNCIGLGTPYGDICFTGVFDGNGKTIRNFTYSVYKSYSVALFTYFNTPGKIHDLIIEDPKVTYIGHATCGALVGRAEGGLIYNCHVVGGSLLWSRYVGALVGDNWGDIYYCSATPSVTGYEHVGGLVGRNMGRIYESFSTGPVDGTIFVGGITGRNSDAFGAYGIIENCYSSSAVTGGNAGGLVGQQWGGHVVNSYSIGTVTRKCSTSLIGGLVGGIVLDGVIVDSFWDTTTSGLAASAGGTGLPTVQMQDINTFLDAGWDFVGESANGTDDIWIMPDSGYPILAWQIPNTAPVAVAGANQIAFAWPDGIGEVTLDGSGSYDDDGDELTYQWSWEIDGTAYKASGVSPTISLPIGVHDITLVVSDGRDLSEPAQTAVQVFAAIETSFRTKPHNILCKKLPLEMRVDMELPVNLVDELDIETPLLLEPWGIEAMQQYLTTKGKTTYVSAFFLIESVQAEDVVDNFMEVVVIGSLRSGQYIYALESVRVH